MEVKLTKDDLKSIQDVREESPVCRFFDHKGKVQFSIGDVLLKKTKNYDDKWETEKISYNSGMPKRYVYIYEDEHGVGFLKLLKTSTGTLGKETICIADELQDSHTKYVVDPDYMDSVLLGDGGFDIKAVRKAVKIKKERIIAHNKAAQVKPTTLKEINNFFGSMMPGQSFFTGSTDGRYTQEYKILSITKKYVKKMSEEDQEDLEYHCDDDCGKPDPKILNDNITYMVEYDDDGTTEEVGVWTFINDGLYPGRPLTMEDEVE